MQALLAIVFFGVGLFVGRLIFAIADLFAVAGWVVTGLFVLGVVIAFAISEKLRIIETRAIIAMTARLTGSRTDQSKIESDALMRATKAVALSVGAIIGIVISVIWSPDVIGALLPF